MLKKTERITRLIISLNKQILKFWEDGVVENALNVTDELDIRQQRIVKMVLTDSSLYNHSFRQGGALAVPSSIHCLDPKHVVHSCIEPMAHKPGKNKEIILSVGLILYMYIKKEK